MDDSKDPIDGYKGQRERPIGMFKGVRIHFETSVDLAEIQIQATL